MDENLRLSDNERLTAMSSLASHFTEGRLDAEEFDDRSLAITRAKTRGELLPLFSDLPGQLAQALTENHGVVEKRSEEQELAQLKKSGKQVDNLTGIIFTLTLVTFLVLTFVFSVSWAWMVWLTLFVTLPLPRMLHGFSDADEKAYKELKEAEELARKERLRRATQRMKELEQE